MTRPTNTPESSCCKLMLRRQAWIPTWRGWLLLLAACVIAGFACRQGAHSFLALDQPVAADVLVVEGWVPNYALKRGLDLSLEQKCRFVLLTGGTVKGEVNPELGDTYAQMALKRLQRIGGDLPHVFAVSSPELMPEPVRDRTYAEAMAVKKWLKDQGVSVRSINVLTVGPHARRSRLLFQKAFGADVEIGVIAVKNREYDPHVWWRYSEGVKEVLSEGGAYFYARLLFWPDSKLF